MSHTVVVGTDGSEHAMHAVLWAADEAARRGAKLAIVHGWLTTAVMMDPTGSSYGPCEQAGATIVGEAAARARQAHPDLEVMTSLVASSGDAALVDASSGADLVVTGARGHGSFASALVGSVADRVLHHAHCSVVIVR